MEVAENGMIRWFIIHPLHQIISHPLDYLNPPTLRDRQYTTNAIVLAHKPFRNLTAVWK